MSLPIDALDVAAVTEADLTDLKGFRCSIGTEWESEVEGQISGPLPRRYLDAGGGLHDPRMLIVRHDDTIVAVAAHRVERPPRIINDEPVCPRYLEVIAVALGARGQRVTAPGEEDRSVGVFAFDAVVSDIDRRPDPAPFLFGRVDPRHTISLAFCDRVGLPIQRPDTDERYVQRWGRFSAR